MYPKDNPVANFIRSLLKDQGLKQRQLAESLAIERSSISQWINGLTMPSDTALLKMARMANVDAEYLLRLKQVVELQKKGVEFEVLHVPQKTEEEELLLNLYRTGDYAAAITMLASCLKRSAA